MCDLIKDLNTFEKAAEISVSRLKKKQKLRCNFPIPTEIQNSLEEIVCGLTSPV